VFIDSFPVIPISIPDFADLALSRDCFKIFPIPSVSIDEKGESSRMAKLA